MTLPFSTHSIPGAGGVFKEDPDDFAVDELPAYEPSGEGEHLFLWVHKRGRSTPEVARALARHLGIPERAVSWAGLKDRQASTRQYFCVPSKVEGALMGFVLPGVEVLRATRHRNKLKTGHLRGNRFTLVLREVRDLGAATAALELLVARGVPNFFGEQRFGRDGENAARGKQILQAGGRHRDRFERKLFLSAYQSLLFNRVLAQRVEAGTWLVAQQGDVLKKHSSHGEFVCAEPRVDQPRVDAFEVSLTGPIFGPSMRNAEGEPGQLEAAVLAHEGVQPSLFEAGGDETSGTRRFLRVALAAVQVQTDPATRRLEVSFELPAGSYATVVLREVSKAPESDADPGGDAGDPSGE